MEIKELEVCFWENAPKEISDEMIAFALDIDNAYRSNKEKYDGET